MNWVLLLSLVLSASAGYLMELNITSNQDINVEFLVYPEELNLREVFKVQGNETTTMEYQFLPELTAEFNITFERNGYELEYHKIFERHEKGFSHTIAFNHEETNIFMTTRLNCDEDFYGLSCNISCSNITLQETHQYCNENGMAVCLDGETKKDCEELVLAMSSKQFDPFHSTWMNIVALVLFLVIFIVVAKQRCQVSHRNGSPEPTANFEALFRQNHGNIY